MAKLGYLLAAALFGVLLLIGPHVFAGWGKSGPLMVAPPTTSAAGPPAGGVPVPAQQMGFTTPVLVANWTSGGTIARTGASPIPVVVGSGSTAFGSYVSGNCGATASTPGSSPSTWTFSWFEWNTGGNRACDSSHIEVANDTTGSFGQALHLTVQNSDNSRNSFLGYPSKAGTTASSTGFMPNEFFVLIRWHSDCMTVAQPATGASSCSSATLASDVHGATALWSTYAGGTTCWVDINQFEARFFPDVRFAGSMQSQGQPTGCVISPDGATISVPTYWQGGLGASGGGYVTMAALVTSDETSLIAQCTWVNPSADYLTGLNNCFNSQSPGGGGALSTQQLTLHNRTHYINLASLGVVGGAGCDAFGQYCNIRWPMQAWIQDFEIWSCPNFASAGCPTTPKTSWP